MWRAALVLAVVGCTGGKSPTLDQAIDRYVAAFCDPKNTCQLDTPASCAFTLQGKLLDVVPNLDDTGQRQCARCLTVRASQVMPIVMTGCNPTEALRAQLLAVCDIDPTFDWNGDADPTDDDTEACAGAP